MVAARTRQATPGIDHIAVLVDRLQAMTEHERRLIWPALEARFNDHTINLITRVLAERSALGWRADPWTMSRHLDPDAIRDWHYTRYLARQFRRAVTGEAPRQVWNLPPQVGKTTWLWRGIAWALDFAPHRKFIYLTYAKHLSTEVSDQILEFSRAHERDLRYHLRTDRQARDRWKTDQGGGFLAASIGSSSAGFGGSVIADDLLANWQEAHSPAARNTAWNEFTSVGGMRLAGDDFMILAHTRWHLDDPTGRVQQLAAETGQKWEMHVLPMHAKENDPLGREPGEVLEPERYTAEQARARAVLVGSYMAQALEEQDPQPEQGGEIQRGWWKLYADDPVFAQLITSWDMKLKDKAGGDYVVGLTVGRVGGAYYVTHMLRGQWTMRTTKAAIALAQVRSPDASQHVIENTGNAPEVMIELRAGDSEFVVDDELQGELAMTDDEARAVEALLRHGMDNLVAQNVKYDKLTRVRTSTIPKVEAGNVYLPERAMWPLTLVDEHAAFPPKTGGHDDIVDALSQALLKLGTPETVTARSTGQIGSVPHRRTGRR